MFIKHARAKSFYKTVLWILLMLLETRKRFPLLIICFCHNVYNESSINLYTYDIRFLLLIKEYPVSILSKKT